MKSHMNAIIAELAIKEMLYSVKLNAIYSSPGINCNLSPTLGEYSVRAANSNTAEARE